VETDVSQSAFVEAAILDPATGQVSIYHPLVTTSGVAPAVAPVVPVLPTGAVVGLWFGSNGDTLKLVGPGSDRAVNGLGRDLFGQFAYINARAFFTAANAAITAGQLVVPPLGVGTDGLPCPTSRDFAVVDQDQSDNLATSYRIVGDATAQNTAANAALGPVLANGSDERLLAEFIDPALGCTPFRLPSLDDPGTVVSSLVGNELSAAANQAAPVALVPLNDPMTRLASGHLSVGKTNQYRAGVDQPAIDPTTETPAAYCASIQAVSPSRLALDGAQFGSVAWSLAGRSCRPSWTLATRSPWVSWAATVRHSTTTTTTTTDHEPGTPHGTVMAGRRVDGSVPRRGGHSPGPGRR
jgi:hypothetical protein